VTPAGLQYVSLADLYAAWLRLLYAVVEMENALLNDYSIRAEQVTYDERPGATHPSLYRAQLLLQNTCPLSARLRVQGHRSGPGASCGP